MVKIRNANTADARFIAQSVLEGLGYQAFESKNDDIVENIKLLEVIAQRTDTLYSYKNVIIAEVDNSTAGALISYPGDSYHQMRNLTFSLFPNFEMNLDEMPDETDSSEFYLDTLAVSPKFRKQKVAQTLLQNRISFAEQNFPKKNIALLVDPENISAQNLYLKLNFQIIDKNVSAFNHNYWKMKFIGTVFDR